MNTICLRLISPRFISVIGAALLVITLHAVPAAADQTASENPPKAVSAQNTRPSGNGASRSDAGDNKQERPGRAAKNRPRSMRPMARPHRPQPVARQRTLPGAASPAYVRSSAPAQSPALVNRGSVQNEAIYRALPVRSGSAIRPGTAAGGNLRHRDPNPPVIGGAASSRSRNTASIDGMQTNLKHSRN